VGKDSIDVDDRFYVGVTFAHTQEQVYLYFSAKLTTVGAFLDYAATHFPKVAFGATTRPAGMSLGFLDVDQRTVDFSLDRRIHLSECFIPFGQIHVSPVQTHDVVAAQALHERGIRPDRVKPESQSAPPTVATAAATEAPVPAPPKTSSATSEPSDPPTSPPAPTRDYIKGEAVIYTGQDGQGRQAIVRGVHYDDPPDTYYTIELQDNKSERQTVAKRLRLDPNALTNPGKRPSQEQQKQQQRTLPRTQAAPLAEASAAGTVSFHVALGSKVAQVRNFPLTSTVSALKKYIGDSTGISIKAQKLSCKGTMLRDEQTIATTKIREGGRVTLISRESADQSSCFS
jgi:hypothetical protein